MKFALAVGHWVNSGRFAMIAHSSGLSSTALVEPGLSCLANGCRL